MPLATPGKTCFVPQVENSHEVLGSTVVYGDAKHHPSTAQRCQAVPRHVPSACPQRTCGDTLFPRDQSLELIWSKSCLAPQEKLPVATKGTCTTGPRPCCWRTTCCFDKGKSKPQPSAAPCQAGTQRRVEVRTPRVGEGAGQAAAGRGEAKEGAPAVSRAGEGCGAGRGTETGHGS